MKSILLAILLAWSTLAQASPETCVAFHRDEPGWVAFQRYSVLCEDGSSFLTDRNLTVFAVLPIPYNWAARAKATLFQEMTARKYTQVANVVGPDSAEFAVKKMKDSIVFENTPSGARSYCLVFKMRKETTGIGADTVRYHAIVKCSGADQRDAEYNGVTQKEIDESLEKIGYQKAFDHAGKVKTDGGDIESANFTYMREGVTVFRK